MFGSYRRSRKFKMSVSRDDRIELAEATGTLEVALDRRARIPEPLPVRLVAVEDVRLITPGGIESRLDSFYVDLLGFERQESENAIVYRAENLRLIINVVELPPEPRDMRAIGIEVQALAEVERELIERQTEFEVQKGLLPGQRSLLLTDPAGNWLELSESPLIR